MVETRVAATLLAQHLKVAATNNTLKLVTDAHFSSSPASTPQQHIDQLAKMLEEVDSLFSSHSDGYTWDEVYSLLGGLSQQQFKERYHPTFEIEATRLQLYKRSRHVVCQLLQLVLIPR